MLMRGDMNKILEEVNGVLEKAFKRIEDLEDRLGELEKPKTAVKRTTTTKKEENS
jgi:hypothetical protein